MRKADKFHWVFTCTWRPSQENENLKQWLVAQSLSPVQHFVTPWTAAHQASLSFTKDDSQLERECGVCVHTPGACSNSCPSNPTISSSVVPFSSFPASGSFPISQLFTSGGQSIGVSASTSVFPMNTQDWSPSEWTGWISLQFKGLSKVFSNTTVQKHQFFSAQLSL